MSNINQKTNISYTDSFELFLKEHAEIFESMSILHTFSSQKYNRYSVMINLPVIFISSVIGFLNVINIFTDQNILLGSISILISLFKSIESYMQYTKRSESHRMLSLSYSKMSKLIQSNLILSRDERQDARSLYEMVINTQQNLNESAPTIDKDIIDKFNTIYKDYNTKKPTICNGLTDVKIHSGFTPKEDNNIELTRLESQVNINM